ncbi:MAG: glutamate N-acetyltransferase/amino-acid N-acetyltransferase [Polyangiales bacterium]|jgi:glutamate N-acetyltransferase/amino-acid N-acetyltransferase
MARRPLHAPLRGFRFAGIASGIKATGLDLGAIVAETPSPVAAVLTKNVVRAAPVELCARRTRAGFARAVLVNSGNANAATGELGMQDATATSLAFAEALSLPGDATKAGDVLPCSTGVIGVPLPTERMSAAMPALVASLGKSSKSFADAILTTDRGRKVSRIPFRVRGKDYEVLAIAKGAGMIHPNMATTLAFALTDAPIGPAELKAALRAATDATFNRISVDGDTSTNDTIIALSSPAKPLTSTTAFQAALTEALGNVAEMIVADGEGAEHVAEIQVEGAKSEADAVKVARTIATSSLVKTAMHGKDPNWGRIAAAAGRAGVRFDQSKLRVTIGSTVVFDEGLAVMTPARERAASKTMSKKRYVITVSLGAGPGRGHYLTCDFGHAYVTVNADYRS